MSVFILPIKPENSQLVYKYFWSWSSVENLPSAVAARLRAVFVALKTGHAQSDARFGTFKTAILNVPVGAVPLSCLILLLFALRIWAATRFSTEPGAGPKPRQ
jgi:hypothetical protein